MLYDLNSITENLKEHCMQFENYEYLKNKLYISSNNMEGTLFKKTKDLQICSQ